MSCGSPTGFTARVQQCPGSSSAAVPSHRSSRATKPVTFGPTRSTRCCWRMVCTHAVGAVRSNRSKKGGPRAPLRLEGGVHPLQDACDGARRGAARRREVRQHVGHVPRSRGELLEHADRIARPCRVRKTDHQPSAGTTDTLRPLKSLSAWASASWFVGFWKMAWIAPSPWSSSTIRESPPDGELGVDALGETDPAPPPALEALSVFCAADESAAPSARSATPAAIAPPGLTMNLLIARPATP